MKTGTLFFFSEDMLLDPSTKRRDIHQLRSEEHTSELQSLTNLVCRLLLDTKKDQKHAVSDQKCARQFVRNQNGGHVGRTLELQNQFVDTCCHDRIQSSRGLVDKQDLRVHR